MRGGGTKSKSIGDGRERSVKREKVANPRRETWGMCKPLSATNQKKERKSHREIEKVHRHLTMYGSVGREKRAWFTTGDL